MASLPVEEKALAMRAQTLLNPPRKAVSAVTAREAHRELLAPQSNTHPVGALRGLVFAVLLASPFWVALCVLLRWWISR